MPPDDQTTWTPPLPSQVRAAAERAEQLVREGYPEPSPGPSSGDNSVGSENPAEPTTVGNSGESAAPSSESPPSPPVDNSGAAEVDWQQRYASLQGKYNSELPELRGQIRSLQDLIGSMQTAQSRAASVTRSAPQIPSEDVESYGQDLITASQRWAEAHLADRFADYERRLSQVETGGQQLARHTAAQSVEHQLDRAIANWREINVEPRFLMWLDQTDPFTGQKRQLLLNEAYGAGDAARTTAFFRAYLAEQTAVSPAGSGIRPNHTGNGSAPPASAERLPLADLAVPGRGQQSSAAAPGASDKRIWTNAEITAFYRQKQQGRFAGREADAEALERDIFAAAGEGRVRQ